jgi:hypothetical protein
MTAAPRWADALRALGRTLEEQQAARVEILNHDAFLAVSWPGGASGTDQRAYLRRDLTGLVAQAQALRAGVGGSPGGALAEQLRTLGQELDAAQVDFSWIADAEEAFEVSGIAAGQYVHQRYPKDYLQELSAQRRATRAAGIQLLSRVRLGAVVVTLDGARIGTLKAVRGDRFEVGTRLFQRDYWLPGSSVTTVGPGERVQLGLTKEQLEASKLVGEPPGP